VILAFWQRTRFQLVCAYKLQFSFAEVKVYKGFFALKNQRGGGSYFREILIAS
jgi:hypothetical protein